MPDMFKPAPIKQTIQLKEFSKMDIRIGTILLVEDIPESDKLVKLSIDFGDHKRTIFTAMKKERKNPKEIEGMQTLFLVNVEQKKIMNEISEGMILDIGYSDGFSSALLIPEKPVPNGSRLG